jgi:hypothetical protein
MAYLMTLLHLKGGPLAEAEEFSFMERIALSSSNEISMAWDRKIDSPLLRTIV